jgi:hypothetical protein
MLIDFDRGLAERIGPLGWVQNGMDARPWEQNTLADAINMIGNAIFFVLKPAIVRVTCQISLQIRQFTRISEK